MLSNHSDRRVTVVEHPDGSRTLAKTYRRANGRQIFDEHVALWNSPFGRMRDLPGIPRPLHFDPANATVTMELIEGIPLGRSNEVDPKIAHCGNAARLLVDFHHSGVIVSRRRSAPSIVRSLQRKAVDLRSSQLGEQYCRLLHRVANMLPQAEDLVVSHGDFSPRNVLRCKARLVIIDLDRLQMSSPARDLAYWGAWVWATQRLTDQQPSWDMGDELLENYLSCAGGPRSSNANVVASLGFHRATALARVVHGWSSMLARPDIAESLLHDAAAALDRRGTTTIVH